MNGGRYNYWKNVGGSFAAKDNDELEGRDGLWNRLHSVDIDGDGDLDVIAGNIGNNTKIKSDEGKPVTLYIDDFDNNGAPDHLMSVYTDGKNLPLLLKRDLVQAMPVMEQQIASHSAYAGQSVAQLFSEAQLSMATKRFIHQTESALLINEGEGRFSYQPLPDAAQQTPIYAITVKDFNRDGVLDMTLAGNFSYVKPDLGRMYGMEGLYLEGLENGDYKVDQTYTEGFFVRGDVRDMVHLTDSRFGDVLLIAVNDGPVRVLQVMER